MAVPVAQRVGRTLARIGHLRSAATQAPEAVPSEQASRSRIASLLVNRSEPASIEQICEVTQLHPNTVRGHLDVLVAAGEVIRSRGQTKGRGRPPWLYSAPTPPVAVTLAQLQETLRKELSAADSASVADQAARRWSAIEGRGIDKKVSTPDEAVDVAVETLQRSGFAADAGLARDRIEITSCPYAEMVAEQPIICDIHTSLVGHVLQETEQGVSVRSMDVWVRPGVCVAHLMRPDQHPARRIAGPGAGHQEPELEESETDR